MILNFNIIYTSLQVVQNIDCYHAGYVWRNSKPVVDTIFYDPHYAKNLLAAFLSKQQNSAVLPELVRPKALVSLRVLASPKELVGPKVLVTPKELVSPKVQKSQLNEVKQKLIAITGIVWKAINKYEGMILLKKDTAGSVIWFNQSNLEKIKRKFTTVRELVGVPLHFDAELLYAPATPGEYNWYQGTAFWDEGQLKPPIMNNLVGANIFDYTPSSEFSRRLKEGLELKRTSQFGADKLDNIFKELTKTKTFTEPQSPVKTVEKIIPLVGFLQIKEPSSSSGKKKNENVTKVETPKILQVKEENVRRTSLPGSGDFSGFSGDNWRASMSGSTSSLPADLVKKEDKLNFPRNETSTPISQKSKLAYFFLFFFVKLLSGELEVGLIR